MSDTPKIQMRDVHKAFGKKVVLDGVDLDVGVGESVVIIGGSGTGKSVTLKSILGLLRPDSGSIKVDGEEVIGMGTADRERVNHKFGMLFQGAALFDSLPVWETWHSVCWRKSAAPALRPTTSPSKNSAWSVWTRRSPT